MRFKTREEKLEDLVLEANCRVVAIAGSATDRAVKQLLLDLHGDLNRGMNQLKTELRK